ncbi:MAG: rubredoxin [Alphaproteobacteria bacterium]
MTARDDAHQIPAGTPFSSLSENWLCPICHGPKEDFLPAEE